MEPQAESISDMGNYRLEYTYELPDILKYMEYHGPFDKMIRRAYNKDDKELMKALIEYRDALIYREKLEKY
jgi:hypothetical protein